MYPDSAPEFWFQTSNLAPFHTMYGMFCCWFGEKCWWQGLERTIWEMLQKLTLHKLDGLPKLSWLTLIADRVYKAVSRRNRCWTDRLSESYDPPRCESAQLTIWGRDWNKKVEEGWNISLNWLSELRHEYLLTLGLQLIHQHPWFSGFQT